MKKRKKALKSIRNVLLSLLITLLLSVLGLVALCTVDPDISVAIADFLYQDQPARPASQRLTVNQSISMLQTGHLENDKEDGTDPTERVGTNGANSAETNYVAPDRSQVSIPEDVSGRSGYQPIQDVQEQVEEADAKELADSLDTGYTGDGLEFDALYYPYYAMLDQPKQRLYRQIYANAMELYPVFAPVEAVTANELKDVFAAVYNDHPELFWLDTAYSGKFRQNGQCVELGLQFNRTAQNLEQEKNAFEREAAVIIEGAQGLSGDYEREKYVHDALIDKISYQLHSELNQSAYSALVNGQTVCAGYARAFQYILQKLSIPCYYCTGYAGEEHAWNIVALEEDYYNVDVTWDDTDQISYDYFNKTDADYAKTHVRTNLSVNLPPCNTTAYRDTAAPDRKKRSAEELGLSPEHSVNTLADYDADCYSQILQYGKGSYTFYNVLEKESLLDVWYDHYQTEAYRQGYLEAAMLSLEAAYCELSLAVEELQDGRWLIHHEINLYGK